MRQLTDEFVKSVADTAWKQIKACASADTIGSWGISELYAQEITTHIDGDEVHMAALVVRVAGFAHKGYVAISLNEGLDVYCIYTTETENGELQERYSEVYCDTLGQILDKVIEKGDMTEEQYMQRIKEAYCMI